MNCKIEYIKSDPNKGFNFGYLLSVPKKEYSKSKTTLVVEVNNTGKVLTDEEDLYVNAKSYFEQSRTAKMIEDLGLPYFIPLFPRYPEEYTHALSRDTILSGNKNIKRIDVQLINMIQDAKIKLRKMGINLEEKYILNGFSASGAFSNRFAILHPELLKCVISGGQTYAIMPLREYNGLQLTYPIGIYDLEEITGIEFNSKEYFKLPQFIYEGDQNNNNDTTKHGDCMTKEQAKLIYSMFGALTKSERLKNQIKIFENLGYINIKMKVYEGIGHKPQVEEIEKFIKNCCSKK